MLTFAPTRVVALGASNLTRGFHAVVATARQLRGSDVEVLAALGHGRSYGMHSSILGRRLPGILDCGLWDELKRRPPAATRALVTDVGNDILYGASVAQILAWVEEAVGRLQGLTPDIVITDLPLASMRGLSRARYLLFRSVLVPACRLPLSAVLDSAEAVVEGLAALAQRASVRFFRLEPEWYGFDPIHIRPRLWMRAWQKILGGEPEAAYHRSRLEALELYLLPPERRWLWGRAQFHPQAGHELRGGGRVWLY